MIHKIFLVFFLFVLSALNVFAQHRHDEKKQEDSLPLSFAHVLTAQLTDPELKTFKMESSVLTIAPGAKDTVSHRHDCELFGFVLEGNVEIALETKEPRLYSEGQMFFEKRNVLHTLTQNKSSDKIAKVLLIFIIKEGRPGYTREYSEAK